MPTVTKRTLQVRALTVVGGTADFEAKDRLHLFTTAPSTRRKLSTMNGENAHDSVLIEGMGEMLLPNSADHCPRRRRRLRFFEPDADRNSGEAVTE